MLVKNLLMSREVFINSGSKVNPVYVHETAVIDDDVNIREGTKIWHFSHILGGTTIGRDCSLGQNVVVGPYVKVGNGCKIQNNVSVYKGITLEDDVFCDPSMVFTNVFNPRAHIARMNEIRETVVKRGATLGANCTIVCGNEIGKYTLIGAGAVVTKSVPNFALMIGNPAHRTGWICKCGEILPSSLECIRCNSKYEEKDENNLTPYE